MRRVQRLALRVRLASSALFSWRCSRRARDRRDVWSADDDVCFELTCIALLSEVAPAMGMERQERIRGDAIRESVVFVCLRLKQTVHIRYRTWSADVHSLVPLTPFESLFLIASCIHARCILETARSASTVLRHGTKICFFM